MDIPLYLLYDITSEINNKGEVVVIMNVCDLKHFT